MRWIPALGFYSCYCVGGCDVPVDCWGVASGVAAVGCVSAEAEPGLAAVLVLDSGLVVGAAPASG